VTVTVAADGRDVGKTADAGYQIGVRRTLASPEERVWAVLLSPEGLRIWLGGVAELVAGKPFAFKDGTSGQVRVHKPWSHLRLTWRHPALERPSVLQVRVIPARTGTTLSIHQEQLAGPAVRADMKAHWEQVINRLAELL
jgi:uncharacterized protein YndB with AHSA1/START domain